MKRPTIDWSAPNYDPVYAYRAEALRRIDANPQLFVGLREYYASSGTGWAEFIQDWMSTSDPRKAGTGQPTTVPFILFPRQIEFVEWVYAKWTAKDRGLGEKSRDVGFSWLAMACSVCVWLFYDEANVGVGSRKKESVDNGPGDPDSLFWKARKLIEMLPRPANNPSLFVPATYPAKEDKWGLIYNPNNGSSIKGEIGDGIGMGGRTSLHFVDEADALEHPMLAEASLSATTDCRIDISTTNAVGTTFYNNRRSLPESQVFIFDWTDDPRKRLNPELPPKQEPWYLKQLRDLPAPVVAAQIDRNPAGAQANTFIPTPLIEVPQTRQEHLIDQHPDTPWSIGVDASGMGADESVVWTRKGRLSPRFHTFDKLDGLQLAAQVEKIAKTLLQSSPVALVCIERDGPGGSCADQLKYGFLGPVLRAIHTQTRLKDGEHYNLRAWLHKQAKDYLEENEVMLPPDPTFLAQATALLALYKGGLLQIEAKDDYRKRLSGASSMVGKMAGRSPDRWDAFVLTFMRPTGKLVKATTAEWDIMAGTDGGWKPLDPVMGY